MEMNTTSLSYPRFQQVLRSVQKSDESVIETIKNTAQAMSTKKIRYYRLHGKDSIDGRNYFFYFDLINGEFEYNCVKIK